MLKKTAALLLALVMLLCAASVLAEEDAGRPGPKGIENLDAWNLAEDYWYTYKVIVNTLTDRIPVYDTWSAKSPVIGYVEPGDIIGYVTWSPDVLFVRAIYNNGQNAGWMKVSDLKKIR